MKRLWVMSLSVAAMAAGGAPGLAEDKPLTERKETVESAIATPVEDLNIKKTKIPEVLVRAQANPYELATAGSCEAIAAEVAALDAELGDDQDVQMMADKAKDAPKGPSAGALLKAGVAQAIPFRGLVRQLSGAAQHDKAVDDAVDAGMARRGFLKGRALEMNCAPPASPAWFVRRPEAAAAFVAESTTAAPVEPAPRVVEVAPAPPVEAPTAVQAPPG